MSKRSRTNTGQANTTQFNPTEIDISTDDSPSLITKVVTTRVAIQTITVFGNPSTPLPTCSSFEMSALPVNTTQFTPCHNIITNTNCRLSCITENQDANFTSRCFNGACLTGMGYIGYDANECPYCNLNSSFCFNSTFGTSCVALGMPQDPCRSDDNCGSDLVCKMDVNSTVGPWAFGYCDTVGGRYGAPSLPGTIDLKRMSSLIFAMVLIMLVMGIWAVVVVWKGVKEAKAEDFSDGVAPNAVGDQFMMPLDIRRISSTFGTTVTTARTDVSSYRPSEKSFNSDGSNDIVFQNDPRFSFATREKGKETMFPSLPTVRDEELENNDEVKEEEEKEKGDDDEGAIVEAREEEQEEGQEEEQEEGQEGGQEVRQEEGQEEQEEEQEEEQGEEQDEGQDEEDEQAEREEASSSTMPRPPQPAAIKGKFNWAEFAAARKKKKEEEEEERKKQKKQKKHGR